MLSLSVVQETDKNEEQTHTQRGSQPACVRERGGEGKECEESSRKSLQDNEQTQSPRVTEESGGTWTGTN